MVEPTIPEPEPEKRRKVFLPVALAVLSGGLVSSVVSCGVDNVRRQETRAFEIIEEELSKLRLASRVLIDFGERLDTASAREMIEYWNGIVVPALQDSENSRNNLALFVENFDLQLADNILFGKYDVKADENRQIHEAEIVDYFYVLDASLLGEEGVTVGRSSGPVRDGFTECGVPIRISHIAAHELDARGPDPEECYDFFSDYARLHGKHVRLLTNFIPETHDILAQIPVLTPVVPSSEEAESAAATPSAQPPEATDLEATDLEATDLEATDPEATDPEAADTEVTDSEVTEPEAADPGMEPESEDVPSITSGITYHAVIMPSGIYRKIDHAAGFSNYIQQCSLELGWIFQDYALLENQIISLEGTESDESQTILQQFNARSYQDWRPFMTEHYHVSATDFGIYLLLGGSTQKLDAESWANSRAEIFTFLKERLISNENPTPWIEGPNAYRNAQYCYRLDSVRGLFAAQARVIGIEVERLEAQIRIAVEHDCIPLFLHPLTRVRRWITDLFGHDACRAAEDPGAATGGVPASGAHQTVLYDDDWSTAHEHAIHLDQAGGRAIEVARQE